MGASMDDAERKHYADLMRAASGRIAHLEWEAAEAAKGPMGDLLVPGGLAERLKREDTMAWLRQMGYGITDHGGSSLYDLEPLLRMSGMLTTAGVYALLRAFLGILPLGAEEREMRLRGALAEAYAELQHYRALTPGEIISVQPVTSNGASPNADETDLLG